MESLTGFSQAPPTQMAFPPHFTIEPSFCCLSIVSSLEPSKKLKRKYITSIPGKRSWIVTPRVWLAIH